MLPTAVWENVRVVLAATDPDVTVVLMPDVAGAAGISHDSYTP